MFGKYIAKQISIEIDLFVKELNPLCLTGNTSLAQGRVSDFGHDWQDFQLKKLWFLTEQKWFHSLTKSSTSVEVSFGHVGHNIFSLWMAKQQFKWT